MAMKWRRITIWIGILTIIIAIIASYSWLFPTTSSRFKKIVIDPDTAAQRAVADINGNGRLDIFAAVDFESGKPVGLYWYSYPTWIRHTIATGVNFRADDMECGDFDGDGDPDMLVTVDDDGKVYWYENPRPYDDPIKAPWKAHDVGITGGYVKDVEVADLDGDGRMEILSRTHQLVAIFSQNGAENWSATKIRIPPKEGMAVGDLDDDGDPDIAFNGFWLETPANIGKGKWRRHSIDGRWYTESTGRWQDNCSNVIVTDLNRDGRNDVVLCHSEKAGKPISWYEATGSSSKPWLEHTIEKRFNYCETLQVADMDLDNDLDVVAGEMKKSFRFGDLIVFLNSNRAEDWAAEKVASRIGIYDGLVADIDSDGDWDIIGCRDFNKPPMELWENRTIDNQY
jgi:hypothetical protein